MIDRRLKEVQCQRCFGYMILKSSSRRRTCDRCKKEQTLLRVRKCKLRKKFPSLRY